MISGNTPSRRLHRRPDRGAHDDEPPGDRKGKSPPSIGRRPDPRPSRRTRGLDPTGRGRIGRPSVRSFQGWRRATANATIGMLTKIATALGAEPSVRFYPSTGPRLHDHVQVASSRRSSQRLHPRWRARSRCPYIDLPAESSMSSLPICAGELVGCEAHGEIRRAERQLRWAAGKTDALPSADGWPWMDLRPRTSRLLILRSTAATRALVQSAPHLFAAAYPGRTSEAVEGLTTEKGTVPDAAIVWVDVPRARASRMLDGPPRGMTSGDTTRAMSLRWPGEEDRVPVVRALDASRRTRRCAPASDALLQSIELAVAAEELGADGAYFRVHHFARQLALAVPAARRGRRAHEADRDRHRRHRHALREPALHGRGRRAPPTSSPAAGCSSASAAGRRSR